MSTDIDDDVLLWSEQQASLLRRLAAGERVNAEIDWPALIAEIEDVGKSELRACESNLRQALVHLLKLAHFPSGPAAHWRGEIMAFVTEAQSCFSPSMRHNIDLNKLYGQALRQVRVAAEPDETGQLPDYCPVAVDDLLDEDIDVQEITKRFR